ncbi:hypothetical protein LAN30_22320, partial [Mycobacterium tuberculosis]|nr:hypothetical protein [Mycobacterium tuberculosis]
MNHVSGGILARRVRRRRRAKQLITHFARRLAQRESVVHLANLSLRARFHDSGMAGGGEQRPDQHKQ